ncbi:hypothetical protein ACJ7K1_28550 [Paenibacillus elgii]
MNVMLLTDIPPCKNFTAGIVLEQLCRFLVEDGHKVSCFAIVDPSLNPDIQSDLLEVMPYKRVDKPKESWGRHPRVGVYASFLANNYIARFKLPNISKQAADFALLNNADIIWSTIQGQTMIKVVRRAAMKAGKPYTVQVWDPPEWWLSENKFDKFTKNSVMNEFGRLLNQSKACLSASWSMAEEYSTVHKANCIPVVPGLDSKIEITPQKREDNDYIIAFAGQIYASAEFNSLLYALEHMNWQHKGKKIRLVLYGRYFQNLHFNKPANISIRGWFDQNAALEEMAAADLLYCPYWFDLTFEKIARLSFPSKLTSYLKTKRPVLIHAPEYASPVKFIKKYNAGYICDTLTPQIIAEQLANIIDKGEGDLVGLRGYNAFLEHLTFETMKSGFYRSLGIERG